MYCNDIWWISFIPIFCGEARTGTRGPPKKRSHLLSLADLFSNLHSCFKSTFKFCLPTVRRILQSVTVLPDWFSTFQTNEQNCGTKSLPILEEEEKVNSFHEIRFFPLKCVFLHCQLALEYQDLLALTGALIVTVVYYHIYNVRSHFLTF